ncbi:uncharacterized protein [Nicotiana sylvestris]|uniref:uncharacterized protein n=1 Tax=Nicotiana sylvestris TaxID=4096 RepID=UPI00388CDC52
MIGCLKVSPVKVIMRFGKKGKLSLRYVGPYRIIQRIIQVAYNLELPPEMSLVHPVFHVSMLKKVVGDLSTIMPVETIEVNEELSYEEIPVAILNRQVRKLRNKKIASVKVFWQNQQVEEATWEAEEDMKKKVDRPRYKENSSKFFWKFRELAKFGVVDMFHDVKKLKLHKDC